MPTSPRRWIIVTAASAAFVTLPAITPPPAPRDAVVVDDGATIALSASWSTEQQDVLDDFARGGLAEVLRVQATSRLTHPDQVQIINDFFEGGVIQTEGRRWIGLFADPQQQAFLTDFLTGGVIQIVRNRLLDSTSDPAAKAAIVAFFPDEVTDYRGGPITMLQRRLIAAAKGNGFVIAAINAVFDNPITLTIRRLIGGGPLIGTPLPDLPPLEPTAGAATAAPGTEIPQASAPVAESAAIPADSRHGRPASTTEIAEQPDDSTTETHVTASRSGPTPAIAESGAAVAEYASEPDTVDATTDPNATTDTTDTTDVVKAGNKVAPTAPTADTHDPSASDRPGAESPAADTGEPAGGDANGS